MSEFHIEVVRIGKVGRHPNADNLSITHIYDYPVIFRTGDFQEGDLAVYVPVDAIVPSDDPRWEFLGENTRVKAKKLRGIFSMGLLTPVWPGIELGQNVQAEMRITKYEPPLELKIDGERETDPGFIPRYTDIEGLRRYPEILKADEPVVVTEKIHGTNARFVHDGKRLWVGGHNYIMRYSPRSVYWQAAQILDLEKKLSQAPHVVFYGEVYGVQDLKYGLNRGNVALRMFDALQLGGGGYLDHHEFEFLCDVLMLPRVPALYEGGWQECLRAYAEGPSTLYGEHIREGIVIKPLKERWDPTVGRVILKLIGEGYYLRRGKKK